MLRPALVFLLSACPALATPIVLPTPKKLELAPGPAVPLTAETTISHPEALTAMAEVLAGELELTTGLRLTTSVSRSGSASASGITLALSADAAAGSPQRYTLEAGRGHIRISGTDPQAVSYGMATLLQLLEETAPGSWQVPALAIGDSPESHYRAVMLDVARKVHSVGVIEDVVRLCRLYKIRYLHLHLTDDQNFTFPFPPVTGQLEGNFTYTRQQLLDLAAYADARGVTIIPELDLPGHSTKLRASGYLEPTATDADVAHPRNAPKINAIIDAMIDTFPSSPYFHIGGDESRAGDTLVPFIARVNQHVRSRDRRLLVWEGFHGAPTGQIPPTGDDRVVVMSWESSYNPPWNLLEHGYELINASWKPTYIVGGYGAPLHPGNSAGRKFSIGEIYRWDPTTFMHWEPRRPVYEDAGPTDPDTGDGTWDADWTGRGSQVLGGQLLFWEQHEMAVLKYLRTRVPTIAERLWNPASGHPLETFKARLATADARVMTIVQPVEISPSDMVIDDPVEDIYHPYQGSTARITMRNRTRVPGTVRFTTTPVETPSGGLRFTSPPPPTTASEAAPAPGETTGSGGFAVRAALFREDGTPVAGHTWQLYHNLPHPIRVTEYNIGRRNSPYVQDLASLPPERIRRTYTMPLLRGPVRNTEIVAQRQETLLTAPGSGTFTLAVRTTHGHATVYLDLDRDGLHSPSEALVRDTPGDGRWTSAEAALEKGKAYRFRVDHNAGLPWNSLHITLEGPGTHGKETPERFLSLPPQ